MPAESLVAALQRLGESRSLTGPEMRAAVADVMAGEAPEPLLAAFLTALRVKGETPDELIGAVRAVRERMTPLATSGGPLLDTCGTGGDGANTVNVSTATALVVAECGVPVAKHGNRSASGNSGSAEVLLELGVNIEASPDVLRRCLDEAGITFLFAPRFHPALRFASPVRKQLPFRTLFNLIGPLANPASPGLQLIGVPGPKVAALVAGALAELGTGRAAVVTGCDGLDEVTLAGPTRVLHVEAGRITEDSWAPEDFGLGLVPAEALRVDGPADSARRIRRVLQGEPDPARDVILANAAAALLVAGSVPSLARGVERAAGAIDSGHAALRLARWAEISQGRG